MKYAKDSICEKKSCKKQAVVFIQGADPDLTMNIPFCREHADTFRLLMMMVSYGDKTSDDIDKWINK
jgi:hypothetical protein